MCISIVLTLLTIIIGFMLYIIINKPSKFEVREFAYYAIYPNCWKCKIIKVNKDNTYDVLFSDNTIWCNVNRKKLKTILEIEGVSLFGQVKTFKQFQIQYKEDK